jgi:hypothetical protein
MIVESLSELQLYINMLQFQKNKVYTDYNQIIADVYTEFGITTSHEQLNVLFSPTVDEEVRDLRELYHNMYGINEY